jgi:hypothetical protein
MQMSAKVLSMSQITCEHEQPCHNYRCANTNNLNARSLDEVEYLAQQGRISLKVVEQYIAMWNGSGAVVLVGVVTSK